MGDRREDEIVGRHFQDIADPTHVLGVMLMPSLLSLEGALLPGALGSWLVVIGTFTVSPDTIQQLQFDIKVRQKKQTNQQNPRITGRVNPCALDEAHELAAKDTKYQAMKNLQHRKRLKRQVFHNFDAISGSKTSTRPDF